MRTWTREQAQAALSMALETPAPFVDYLDGMVGNLDYGPAVELDIILLVFLDSATRAPDDSIGWLWENDTSAGLVAPELVPDAVFPLPGWALRMLVGIGAGRIARDDLSAVVRRYLGEEGMIDGH